MKKKTNEEFIFLVNFYLKNKDLTPHKLVSEAQNVDLIRDKFTKTTIYNYFLYFKRYIKDGYFCKGVQKRLKDAFEKVCKSKNISSTKNVYKKQINFEEELKILNEKINKEINDTKDKFDEIIIKNNKKIEDLKRFNDEIKYFCESKIRDIEIKRHDSIQELLKLL